MTSLKALHVNPISKQMSPVQKRFIKAQAKIAARKENEKQRDLIYLRKTPYAQF